MNYIEQLFLKAAEAAKIYRYQQIITNYYPDWSYLDTVMETNKAYKEELARISNVILPPGYC